MMGNSCVSYVKQVGRQLRCSKSEKKRLLAGLETELADTFPESESLSLAGISAQFGAPKDVAAELQAALPAESRAQYITHRKRVKRTALAGLVLVLIVSSVFWFAKWGKAQEVIRGDFYVVMHPTQQHTEEEFNAKLEKTGVSIPKKGE